MSTSTPQLVLSTSPFVKRAADTPAVMRHVIYSLLPVIAAAVYFFGVTVLLVLAASIAGALLAEWFVTGRGSVKTSTLTDGSALLTAILLALVLPPAVPLWMAFLGGVVAIVLGKALFGGLGQNVFNPALAGRAFLQASFPEAMTTWQIPREAGESLASIPATTLTLPFVNPVYDGVSAATPLAQMKFESTATPLSDLFFGTIAGSMGETSAMLLILGGAYLAYRRFLNWRIPIGVALAVFLFAAALNWNDNPLEHGLFHVMSGGLLLGAIYMATDPVTSPVTPKGCWLFAAGIGFLVVLIRLFGGLPEGVMYSILFMNGLVPLIDRYTQPRIYGAAPRKAEA